MKKMLLMINLIFLICLSACDSKNEEQPQANKEVLHVSSSDILKLTKDMSIQSAMDDLGETVHGINPFGWFLYIVDDMQYLHTFTDMDEKIGASGSEILETIKSQNTEKPPLFISIKEAAKILKTMIIVNESWMITFSDSNYVYVKSGGGLLFFRYNIQKNEIDRALDCRDFVSFHTAQQIEVKGDFMLNGLDSIVHVATGSPHRGWDEYIGTYPFEYMYTVNFENESVLLLSKGFDSTKYPSENAIYSSEGYETIMSRYLGRIKENTSLPIVDDSTIITQIDDDRFCIITNEGVHEYGYYDYKIIIVDANESKVIQECSFLSMEIV